MVELVAAPTSAADKLSKIEVPGKFGNKTYTDVTLLEVVDQGVKISHSGGLVVIPLSALPPELQSKYLAKTPSTAPAPPEPPPKPSEDISKPSVGSLSNNRQGDGLVLIKGMNGSASGFLVTIDNQQYFYTAVHVLADIDKPKFVTPAGQEIRFHDLTRIEVSDQERADDVVRIRMEQRLPSSYVFSEDAGLGDSVVGLGNSSGEGVVTSRAGKILGIGPTEIEIDAKVVPGNSGGPILLEGTNKVVGLVTRAVAGRRDIWTKDTPSAQVRRFAVKPTKVQKWLPMDLMGLRNQGLRLEALRTDSRSLAAVLFLTYKRGAVEAPAKTKGDFELREVLRVGSVTPVGKSIGGAIGTINRSLTQSGTTLAAPYLKQLYAKYFASIYAASRTGVATARPEDYVRFLRPKFKEEADLRKEIVTELLKFSNSVQTQIGNY